MELSKSITDLAIEAIQGENPQDSLEGQNKPIPIEGTPFFVSSTGDGIIAHGQVLHEHRPYYVGTIDNLE